jgi:hypothetical protein
MLLFPIVKKSRQLVVKILSRTTILVVVLAFFLRLSSRFTGLDWLIDYLFAAGVILLVVVFLFRIVFKTTVDSGFVGFNGPDFFIKGKNKSFHIDIPFEKIERIEFKPGHSAETYPTATLFFGLFGMLLGNYEGTDSLLTVHSDFGVSHYHMKFETDRQIEIFSDILKKHPKAVILKKN